MEIMLNNPGSTPAVPPMTYPILWLSRFVCGGNPNGKYSVFAAIDKMGITGLDENNNPVFALMPGGRVNINIDDFFGTADADQLAVTQSLLLMVQKLADPPAPK